MNIFRFALGAALICGMAGGAHAQLVPPAQIKDTQLSALQSKHLSALAAAAAEIAAHNYPSKFYLTHDLDLKNSELRSADQRSIEFGRLEQQIVLIVRGNYTAAYPTSMPAQDRVSRTYLDVVVPILSAVIPRLNDESELSGIAIEVSDHVRKVNVVTMDRFENLSFVIPRATAVKVTGLSDPDQQLAALSDARVYADNRVLIFDGKNKAPAPAGSVASGAEPPPPASSVPTARSPAAASVPEQLHAELQPQLDRMVLELGPQAHFDPLAKPALFQFRAVPYLSIPVITTLPATDAGSQYRLAALAFDRHVSHLIRSVLPYVKSAPGFEGIDFRATTSAGLNSMPDIVEFLFPLRELQRYENYDVTGQQLINTGFVLINGERVSLDLQGAEAVKP